MSMTLVTIHGINTVSEDYAEALFQNIPDCQAKYMPLVLSWSDLITPYIESWRAMFADPSRLQLIQEAHESAVWMATYELPVVKATIISRMRRAIIDRLAILPAGEKQMFVFVAHSLGTCVLVDAMQSVIEDPNINLWKENVAGIVTMGSPLDYWRTLADLQAVFDKLAGGFPWLNIYDPLDGVAGPLAPLAGVEDAKVENCFWTLSRLLNSHVEYWSSARVAEMIDNLLTGTPLPGAVRAKNGDKQCLSF